MSHEANMWRSSADLWGLCANREVKGGEQQFKRSEELAYQLMCPHKNFPEKDMIQP